MSDRSTLTSRDVRTTLGLDRPKSFVQTHKKLAWTVAAALTAVIVVALARGGDENQVSYTTQPARRGDLTVTVTATGTLQPTNQVEIGSELSGTIRTVEVDFNDTVRVGEVLAQLDTTRLDAQVKQSRAALESAEAIVTQARASQEESERQFERLQHVRDLSGGKVPSEQEFAAAQATRARARATTASAQAAVVQARATLEAQLTDFGKTAIRSPINGIVLSRTVEPGQTVAASLQAPILFTLAEDLTRMELRVSVDEADVGQVANDQEATFTVDAWPDRTFSARVQQVRFGAQTVAGVVTYETVLAVDNSEGLLRPGMTATAEITVRQVKDALLVPNAALRFVPPAPPKEEEQSGGLLRALIPMPRFAQQRPTSEGGGKGRKQRVWALHNGSAQEVAVSTGASDGAFTEITEGDLAAGTELIVDAAVPSSS